MLVLVKSGPDTVDGRRGVKFARDMAADLVLLQNGVYYAQRDRLEGFCGTVYVLDEDVRLRGLGPEEIDADIRRLDYDRFISLMAEDEKVAGAF